MISKTLKFGLVTLALCSFSLTQAQEKKKPNPEKMFASFDTNEDKAISLEEFKTKKRRNEVKPEMLEKRFKVMDKNEDGSVSLEEFKEGMQGGKGKGDKKKKQE